MAQTFVCLSVHQQPATANNKTCPFTATLDTLHLTLDASPKAKAKHTMPSSYQVKSSQASQPASQRESV